MGTAAGAGAALELLGAYSEALDEEYQALLAADEDRLTRATGRKRALIPALAALEPSAFRRGSAPALALAGAAERNARNGILITERLADVERRAAFFARAAGLDAPSYGAQGAQAFAPRARLRARG